jgi:glycosyltransferase involved in cell wall biosynthesis
MSKKQRTILQILHLNPCKVGSMEEYMLWMTRRLREDDWSVGLIFEKTPIPELERAYMESGAFLDYLPVPKGIAQYWHLHKLLRKYRPEIVHFHFCSQFSLLPVITKLSGVKRIYFTEHIRTPLEFSWAKRLKLRIWDRAVLGGLGVHILAVSEHIKQILIQHYETHPKRVEVVPNGINLERFKLQDHETLQDLRYSLGIGSSSVITCASNLRPEKGVDVLIRALVEILPRFPYVNCVIVGDGPCASELVKLASELNLEDTVCFAGLRSDVHAFMHMAEVVVVPSTWQEPAGLVVIEAMAASKPVVASRVGGIPEFVINGETGLLVAADNPQELAQALLRILESKEQARQMGRRGRERVEQYFSMTTWVNNTLSKYNNG